MLIVYGIKNCDSVKKAMQWLALHQIEAKLHDFRLDGIEKDVLLQAKEIFGWEKLVNKRSTTWRNLPQDVKDNLCENNILDLLLEQPTLIKRPLMIKPALLGFNMSEFEKTFLKN